MTMKMNHNMHESLTMKMNHNMHESLTMKMNPHMLLQVAPVVDASSSQSRIDVLGILMSAVLLLTGLQWLSLKAREMLPVS
jgi:hypothetical protein